MPALTPDQRAELARLRARADEIRRRLVELGDLLIDEARPGVLEQADSLRREFTDAVSRIQDLESVEGTAERGAMMSRDRAFAAVARQQERSAARIGAIYREAARELTVIYTRDPTGFLAAVRQTVGGAHLLRGREIREVMLRVAKVSEILNHELAVRTFGREAVGEAAGALGLVLGGGLPLEVVDGLWGAAPVRHGLAWLLNQADRADMEGLVGKLRELVSLGANSRSQYKRLREAGMPLTEFPKWVTRLGAEARRAAEGVPGALEEYRNLQREARAYLALRKKGPLGTQGAGNRLVQRLDKAVRETDVAAVERALNTWLERKTSYNGVLAMRSATNRTYDGVNTRLWLRQPWVYAVRWVLAANHPKVDVCNAIALFDMGRGRGVYPIGQAPEDHPNGLCRLEPAIDEEFLDKGAVPLGWAAPEDADRLAQGLSFDGAFAKNAAGADTLEELQQRMADAGFGPRAEIPLVRTEDVGPDNLLRAGRGRRSRRRPVEPPVGPDVATAVEEAATATSGAGEAAVAAVSWRAAMSLDEHLDFGRRDLEETLLGGFSQAARDALPSNMSPEDRIGYALGLLSDREWQGAMEERAARIGVTRATTRTEALRKMGFFADAPRGVWSDRTQRAVERGLVDFSNAVPDRWFARHKDTSRSRFNKVRSGKYSIDFVAGSSSSRSSASRAGRVNLEFDRHEWADQARKITWHELGHTLEYEDEAAARAIHDWFTRRTKGEASRPLAEVTGLAGYRPNEVTRRDKFYDAYVGKVYAKDDKARYASTEILSTAVENLASRSLARELLRRDPEHFFLIWSLLYAP